MAVAGRRISRRSPRRPSRVCRGRSRSLPRRHRRRRDDRSRGASGNAPECAGVPRALARRCSDRAVPPKRGRTVLRCRRPAGTGCAHGDRRPARGPHRDWRARGGRARCSAPGRIARATWTGRGPSRSWRGAAGCSRPPGATLDGAFRDFERRCASMRAVRTRSSTRARCSRSAGRSGARSNAAPLVRASTTRWLASSPRRAPLGRAGPRRAEPGSVVGHRLGAELTEAERRIAHLVAEGTANREVAAALFLTVHSVETALTTSTASSASARAPSWRAGTRKDLRFPGFAHPRPQPRSSRNHWPTSKADPDREG